MQASVGGDFPFYTYARVCAYSQSGPGALVMPFAIGGLLGGLAVFGLAALLIVRFAKPKSSR